MKCAACGGTISATAPGGAILFGKQFCDRDCRDDYVAENTRWT